MTSFEKGGPQERRTGLFIFAIFLLLLAPVAFFVGSHNYLIRSLSVLAMIASAYLVRASNFHSRPTPLVASEQMEDFNATNGPGLLAWVLGLGLILMLVLSFLLVQSDALHGGHTGWPADLFGAVALACAVTWGYIVSKFMSGRR
ncbi:MAG: hypothetical protein WCF30_07020 [Terracidiphilus sp.]